MGAWGSIFTSVYDSRSWDKLKDLLVSCCKVMGVVPREMDGGREGTLFGGRFPGTLPDKWVKQTN